MNEKKVLQIAAIQTRPCLINISVATRLALETLTDRLIPEPSRENKQSRRGKFRVARLYGLVDFELQWDRRGSCTGRPSDHVKWLSFTMCLSNGVTELIISIFKFNIKINHSGPRNSVRARRLSTRARIICNQIVVDLRLPRCNNLDD